MNEVYYLKIPDLNGGSQSNLAPGAFEIESFEFSLQKLINVNSGSVRSGRNELSPIEVELFFGTALSKLAQAEALGTRYSSVQLEGFAPNLSDNESVYDLRLGNVLVKEINDSGAGPDTLSLVYDEIELTTTGINSDGSRGAQTTFLWNVVENRVGNGVGEASPDNSGTPFDPAVGYYLIIDGVDGGSRSVAAPGAFEIEDFNLNLDNAIETHVGAGGGVANAARRAPLEVDLVLGPGLPTLATALVSGTAFPSVQIKGVSQSGDVVYDLRLGNALLGELQENGTELDKLKFAEMEELELITGPFNDSGVPEAGPVFRWNIVGNTVGNGVDEPSPFGTGVNSDPLVQGERFVGDQNEPVTGNVLSNDRDRDGDTLEAAVVTEPQSGMLDLMLDGTFTYVPFSGFAGIDTFTYVVSDGNGGSAEADATIEVTAPGPLLFAVNAGGDAVVDFAGTPDGIPVTFDADDGSFVAEGGQRTSQVAALGGATTLNGSERWDPSSGQEMLWQFDVGESRSVVVDLYFAETYKPVAIPGGRVFDVAIEGALALDDFDINSEADFGELVARRFETTVGADGVLDIAFLNEGIDHPQISAIAVHGSGAYDAPIDGAVRGDLIQAVNAGGNAVLGFTGTPDGNATDFAADDGSFLAAGGQRIALSRDFGGASTLEGSERWDGPSGQEMLWRFDVGANQEVIVDLYVAETYAPVAAPGLRVFDVAIERSTVLDDFDISAQAALGELVTESFRTQVGADGILDIAFLHDVAENPTINAIAIYEADTLMV